MESIPTMFDFPPKPIHASCPLVPSIIRTLVGTPGSPGTLRLQAGARPTFQPGHDRPPPTSKPRPRGPPPSKPREPRAAPRDPRRTPAVTGRPSRAVTCIPPPPPPPSAAASSVRGRLLRPGSAPSPPPPGTGSSSSDSRFIPRAAAPGPSCDGCCGWVPSAIRPRPPRLREPGDPRQATSPWASAPTVATGGRAPAPAPACVRACARASARARRSSATGDRRPRSRGPRLWATGGSRRALARAPTRTRDPRPGPPRAPPLTLTELARRPAPAPSHCPSQHAGPREEGGGPGSRALGRGVYLGGGGARGRNELTGRDPPTRHCGSTGKAGREKEGGRDRDLGLQPAWEAVAGGGAGRAGRGRGRACGGGVASSPRQSPPPPLLAPEGGRREIRTVRESPPAARDCPGGTVRLVFQLARSGRSLFPLGAGP